MESPCADLTNLWESRAQIPSRARFCSDLHVENPWNSQRAVGCLFFYRYNNRHFWISKTVRFLKFQSLTFYGLYESLSFFYRFGKANIDEFSIITPLRQCCQIRKSTFLKLAKLYIGPERLSELLDKSMKSDPVYPILLQAHLNAIDRRVIHILRIVARCLEQEDSVDAVIINDSYWGFNCDIYR